MSLCALECACVGVSSRRFPPRAVLVRPRAVAVCACAATAGACAAAAVPPPLLLLGCCCRAAASSEDVSVIDRDDACSTDGAATEAPEAAAEGKLSGEDIARLLLKLNEFSLIGQNETKLYG